MDGFSTAFMIVFAFAVLAPIVIGIAILPGYIARKRHHKNAEAISICGIIGAFLWPAWIVAIVWAHTSNVESPKKVGAFKPPPTARKREADDIMSDALRNMDND